jgi:hypothetical protein
MCINNNELFVSDYGNRKIKIFSLKGEQIDTIHSVGAFSIAVVDDIIAISDHFAITLISRDESVKNRVDLESTSASYPLAAGQLEKYCRACLHKYHLETSLWCN